MSDHLPECPALDETQPGTPVVADNCYCDRLRACEQRSYTLGIEVGKHDGWVAGHAAGVLAARDAVAAASLRIPYEDRRHVYLDDALAAIDALRGSGNPDTPPSAEKGEKP